jgi:hypothetical protein
VSDDFTTFRAAHASVLDAIGACDRPDWLVLLAQEVAEPRTAVRIGLGAAQLLSSASDTLWLFKPNPDRLETLAAWAGDDDGELARSSAFARAVVLASLPATVLAYVLVTVVAPGAWTGRRELAMIAALAALEVIFTMVLRRALAAVVRRRAARLDERAALGLVLDEIRRGATASPRRVPIAVHATGRRLRRCLAAGDPG